MNQLQEILRDLVIANRILARQGVVDVYGHVSVRHPERPDRYFLSRSRSPALVTVSDILEFALDGTPTDQQGRSLYAERYIHSAIYEARADVNSVIHNHAPEVIPFTVTPVRLRPVAHVCASIGETIPVWDIRRKFGDTNMLVMNMEQGRDLASALGTNTTMLMRGHGSVVIGRSVREAVMAAVYLQVNAKLQAEAMRLSDEVEYLTSGEIRLLRESLFADLSIQRAWEYWKARADCTKID